MAEKRYFWLKLKEDYFNNPKIKKLRKIAGGDTYTIIYLKMQLLSISNKGIIEFEGIEKTFSEELALKLDEQAEDVAITIIYLQNQNLIESNNNNEYFLLEASNNIGSESDGAERVRKFREKKENKLLHCNNSVTQVKRSSISNSISISNSNSNSISITKEIKHKYGEYKNILLSDKELSKLKEDFGEQKALEMIKVLDEGIELKGYKYKNHNLALRKWEKNTIANFNDKKQNEPPKKQNGIDLFREMVEKGEL